MRAIFKTRADARTVPIIPIETAVFEAWRKAQPRQLRNWVESTGFTAKAGKLSLVAGPDGGLSSVLIGLEAHDGFWAYADLPGHLPAGNYRIDARMEAVAATGAALGWALGCYAFDRYSAEPAKPVPGLVWPGGADRDHVLNAAAATATVRDLINTPTNDMGRRT